MINLSNLFGGEATTDQPVDASAGAQPTELVQDLFAAAEDTGAGPHNDATAIADPPELDLLKADDEVGSIVASMIDLSSDPDTLFA